MKLSPQNSWYVQNENLRARDRQNNRRKPYLKGGQGWLETEIRSPRCLAPPGQVQGKKGKGGMQEVVIQNCINPQTGTEWGRGSKSGRTISKTRRILILPHYDPTPLPGNSIRQREIHFLSLPASSQKALVHGIGVISLTAQIFRKMQNKRIKNELY